MRFADCIREYILEQELYYCITLTHVYRKVKKLLHRMPDPNYAKVAFSVARLQEHVRDVETANRNMAVHVDELEITLCHERRRFQQELESQRKTFQEREQCLIDQLLFDCEICPSEDS